MRRPLRSLGLFLARLFGSRIVDVKTGRILDKALIIPWRGRIHIIGAKANIRPVFEPQQHLSYWKQTLGFTVHESPDFPRIPSAETKPTDEVSGRVADPDRQP